MTPITSREKEILDFIKNHIEKWGFSPTYKQIGQAFGTSAQNAWHLVTGLEKAGRIRRYPGKRQGIEII